MSAQLQPGNILVAAIRHQPVGPAFSNVDDFIEFTPAGVFVQIFASFDCERHPVTGSQAIWQMKGMCIDDDGNLYATFQTSGDGDPTDDTYKTKIVRWDAIGNRLSDWVIDSDPRASSDLCDCNNPMLDRANGYLYVYNVKGFFGGPGTAYVRRYDLPGGTSTDFGNYAAFNGGGGTTVVDDGAISEDGTEVYLDYIPAIGPQGFYRFDLATELYTTAWRTITGFDRDNIAERVMVSGSTYAGDRAITSLTGLTGGSFYPGDATVRAVDETTGATVFSGTTYSSPDISTTFSVDTEGVPSDLAVFAGRTGYPPPFYNDHDLYIDLYNFATDTKIHIVGPIVDLFVGSDGSTIYPGSDIYYLFDGVKFVPAVPVNIVNAVCGDMFVGRWSVGAQPNIDVYSSSVPPILKGTLVINGPTFIFGTACFDPSKNFYIVYDYTNPSAQQFTGAHLFRPTIGGDYSTGTAFVLLPAIPGLTASDSEQVKSVSSDSVGNIYLSSMYTDLITSTFTKYLYKYTNQGVLVQRYTMPTPSTIGATDILTWGGDINRTGTHFYFGADASSQVLAVFELATGLTSIVYETPFPIDDPVAMRFSHGHLRDRASIFAENTWGNPDAGPARRISKRGTRYTYSYPVGYDDTVSEGRDDIDSDYLTGYKVLVTAHRRVDPGVDERLIIYEINVKTKTTTELLNVLTSFDSPHPFAVLCAVDIPDTAGGNMPVSTVVGAN